MARIISGKEISIQIRDRLRGVIKKYGLKPRLAILQVGDLEDSNVYIRMKKKYAQEVGVTANHFKLPRSTTTSELISKLDELNTDNTVHGIIVQLPLDSEEKIDASFITNSISPRKDVDGLTHVNAGKLLHGDISGENSFLPCTPSACLELIKASGIQIQGAKAVVLGRSRIVGSPVAQLLVWSNATVTIVHSKSQNIDQILRDADIVVSAMGCAHFVKKDWIKPGAVVIDCGITVVQDSIKSSGRRLMGDVEPEAKELAAAITPVPGGVGPVTVAMLIKNTVHAALKMECRTASNVDVVCRH